MATLNKNKKMEKLKNLIQEVVLKEAKKSKVLKESSIFGSDMAGIRKEVEEAYFTLDRVFTTIEDEGMDLELDKNEKVALKAIMSKLNKATDSLEMVFQIFDKIGIESQGPD